MKFTETFPVPNDCANRPEFVALIQEYLIRTSPEKYQDQLYAMNVARQHAILIWADYIRKLSDSLSEW